MKAILVLKEMPKTCDECPLMCWEDEGTDIHPNKWVGCWLNKREIDGKKPNWCPLKPLPEKRFTRQESCCEYCNGFNACLEEIEE